MSFSVSSHRRRTRKIKRGEPVGLKRYCHAAENQIPSNLHSVLFAWDQTGSRDEDFRLHRSSSLVSKSQIRPPLHLPHSSLIKRSSAGTLLFKARRALPSLSPPPLLPSLGKGRDLTGSPSIKLKSPLENPKESERSDLRRVSDLDITDASSPLWMGVTLLYYIFTPTFPTPPNLWDHFRRLLIFYLFFGGGVERGNSRGFKTKVIFVSEPQIYSLFHLVWWLSEETDSPPPNSVCPIYTTVSLAL